MKSFLKIFLIVLFFLLLATTYFLPEIISTSIGTTLLEAKLSEKLGGRVTIKSISLHWAAKQKAKEIVWTTKEHKLKIGSVVIDAPLLSLTAALTDPMNLLLGPPLEARDLEYIRQNQTTQIALISSHMETPNEIKISVETKVKKRAGNLLITGVFGKEDLWNAQFRSFPSEILTLFKPSLPLPQIVGPTFNGTVKLTTSSNSFWEWDLDLRGQNLYLTGSGSYDGAIRFLKPFHVDFILTEELSQKLFTTTSVKPITAKAIHIDIDPENALIPMRPFSLKGIHIPRVDVNLGKVNCKNFGTLASLLSIIELRPRFSQDVMVWIQNMPLSIENGICQIPRTEMLVDYKYQLGAWGSFHLPSHSVDMQLAITAQALRQGFGLTSIPDHYAVVLKVDGPLSDIEIHKSKALRQIAKLALLEQIPIKLFPKSATTPHERHPFPWE